MTILDDNKYIAENKYRQYLQNTINQNATGEIEVQLSVAPVSNFGWLIINPDSSSTREEIFYHRKDGNSVFVYDVNRTDAKTHTDGSLVVLNNTAGIYNFKEKLNDNIFYHYKISDNDLYIFGGVIVDFHGVRHDIDNFSTESLSMTNNATNYIYIGTLDDGATYEPLVTTTNSNDLFIIKEVTKDPVGVITTINEGRQSWRGISTNGGMGIKGDDGNGIVNIELLSTVGKVKTYRINFTDSTNFTYEVIDGEAITLPVYTITNDIATRTLNANSVSLHGLADVVSTLIKDIKDGLEVIGTDGEDGAPGLPGAPGVDGLDGNGIESITLISTVGKVKTYRITYTDTTTFDYTVTDGDDGVGGDMFKSENLSGLSNYTTARTNLDVYSISEVDALIPDISGKQDTLVSGTNIKTINGTSVLGSGNIVISGGDKKYCIAGKDVSQSITSGGTATLNDFVFQTNDSGMSVTSNRITITQTGMYLIGGQITFAYNNTGLRELIVRRNGSSLLQSTQTGANTTAGGYSTVTFSRIQSLTAGDYLELRAYQTSGSAVDALSIDPYRYTFFYVKEI